MSATTLAHIPAPDDPPHLAAALDSAARGWHVFPLAVGRKAPPALHGATDCSGTGSCIDGHRGWEQRATTDPDRIRACWSRAPFNIGIATGPSGLVVIDLDTAKPDDQLENLPSDARQPGVLDGHDVFALLCDRVSNSRTASSESSESTTSTGSLSTELRPPDGNHL